MLILGTVLGFGVALVVFALLRRQDSIEPADPDFLAEFSLEKYRPMERILDARDFRFLEAQPGFQPAIARKLRRERRRAFRSYLTMLAGDFNRIHRAALEAVLASGSDRAELSALLVRQKTTFELTLWAVRIRLALSVLGVGTVNVAPLLEALSNVTTVSREFRMQAAS